jgi:hypothetical protein
MAANNQQVQQAQTQAMLQQWQAQQAALALKNQDLAFMRSLEKFMYCPVTGGNGTSQSYIPGTLFFDLPVAPSGFAKGILIHYNLTVTPATASGAAYAVNPAAPWSMFSQFVLTYNGAQATGHPYEWKVLDQLKGFQRGQRNQVLAGNNDSTIAGLIVGSTPIVINTANTWQGSMYYPFNALSEDSVAGILPISGAGTKGQLQLTVPSTFLGNDPFLYPMSASGGTNPSVTATGTVSCEVVYLDGSTANGTSLLPPPPSVYGSTLQYYREPDGTPFNPGLTFQRYQLQTKMDHQYCVSIIIDGNQSSTFSTVSNILGIELTGDPTGSQKIMSFGNGGNNVPMSDYYDRYIRRKIGQDLDPGVIVWAAAPVRGTVNASNHMGLQNLNCYPGGFPTATIGASVNTTTTTNGYAPRIVTFDICLNHQGLGLQQVG